MDFYISLCLDSLCLSAQAVMHILFISRLTGQKAKLWHFATYFLLLCIIEIHSQRRNHSNRHWSAGPVPDQPLRLKESTIRLVSVHRSVVLCLACSPLALLTRWKQPSFLIFRQTIAQSSASVHADRFLLSACCYRAVLKFLAWTEGG